ncbi:MAG: hypothetical protein ACE5IY_20990 [bacterium]
MASEATIIQQVEMTVQGQYSKWKIGITDGPARRRAQLGNPLSWLHWQADSEEIARAVKHHFLSCGMHKAGRAKSVGHFVYILLL